MKIEIDVSSEVFLLLSAIGEPNTVVRRLVDHAQQAVYRPGSWERDWIKQAFGDEWTARLEPDPTRPMFQRPRALNAVAPRPLTFTSWSLSVSGAAWTAIEVIAGQIGYPPDRVVSFALSDYFRTLTGRNAFALEEPLAIVETDRSADGGAR